MTSALLVALSVLANSSGQTHFSRGLPSDPGYFPIAVWLQDPSNALRFKAAGFNLYVGLWQGPTEAQLSGLKAAGMPVICEQNEVGLSHKTDPIIVGWMHGDEPDNAQPVKGGYGPCIPPAQIVQEFEKYHLADPTRPVMLNLGQGVANDEWLGRGNGSSLKDYETYVKGGDIVSFDVYPIAGLPKPDPENFLWYVPKGLDRLASWMGGTGSRWNCIECTRIGGGKKASPPQVRSEVWMSLIHGSKGLIYFVHQFKPTFDEHALLDDPEMLQAVTSLNAQIRSLAPALNSPSLPNIVSVKSSSDAVPIDLVAKRLGHDLYVFAVGMRNGPTEGNFTISRTLRHAVAHVVNENRSINIVNGRFSDRFRSYEPHIYRIEE